MNMYLGLLLISPSVSRTESFFTYKGGIYSSGSCSGPVNHGLVVYGYKWTGDMSTSYWLVRNSWGAGFGEKGNMRISMRGSGDGMCKMYTYAVHPPLKLKETVSTACLDGRC